jgi:hypothetical protein
MEPKGREYLSLFLQPLTDQPIHNFKFQISNPPPIQSHIIPHFVSNFNFNSSLFGSLSHPLKQNLTEEPYFHIKVSNLSPTIIS